MTPTGEDGGGTRGEPGLDLTTDPDAGPPDDPGSAGRGRHRFLIVACMVGGLGAFGIGAAVALNARASDSTSRAADAVGAPTVPAAVRFPASTTTKPRPTSSVASTSPTPASTGATSTTAAGLVASPPVFRPGPAPTDPPTSMPAPSTTVTPTSILSPAVTAVLPPPPPFGPEALTWTAPKLIEVVAGHTATFSVSVHNPESRDAAMPHPLSCAPHIDGSEFCADVVQLVPSHATVTQKYTIDATGIAPGHYVMRVEGVVKIAVTVTAAETP